MGLNSENAERVVFDIETAPLPDAADYIEPADAPANYKDPVKIAVYLAEKQAENLARCGLDVDLCRVVAIGMHREGSEPIVNVALPEDERTLVASFWTLVGDRHLVGFNCLGFDLPVLLRRSLYLGIQAPFIQIDKFKHPQVTDLMRVLDYNGAIKSRGLAFYCKRFGIQVEDKLTGADIAQAVAENRWADVAAHCKADVERTAQLAAKLGAFRLTEAAVL